MTSALQYYFAISGCSAGLSSVFYILLPSGTTQYFGGIPTKSSQLWTQLTAAGDLLISYLCWIGYRNSTNDYLRTIIVRGMGIYSWVHFGLFLHHHKFVQKHPKGAFPYLGGLVLSTAAVIKWGSLSN